MKLQILIVAIFITALQGCATNKFEERISDTPVRRTVTLEKPLIRITQRTWASAQMEHGLLAGDYVSLKENAEGIFFYGPERPVFRRNMDLKNPIYFVEAGGFWVPKNRNGKPRLFAVFEPEMHVADSVSITAMSIAANASLAKGTTPLPGGALAQGVGVGIGTGIVTAMIEADRGRVVIFPPIEDEEFMAQLQAAISTSKKSSP